MQPSPCNIWIKALEGAEEKPRSDCAPPLFPSTLYSLGCASPPARYIQGRHEGATATSGHRISGVTHKEPSLAASQSADAAYPPWAIFTWSLSPASIPWLGHCHPPATPAQQGPGAEAGWCGGRQ